MEILFENENLCLRKNNEEYEIAFFKEGHFKTRLYFKVKNNQIYDLFIE